MVAFHLILFLLSTLISTDHILQCPHDYQQWAAFHQRTRCLAENSVGIHLEGSAAVGGKKKKKSFQIVYTDSVNIRPGIKEPKLHFYWFVLNHLWFLKMAEGSEASWHRLKFS